MEESSFDLFDSKFKPSRELIRNFKKAYKRRLRKDLKGSIHLYIIYI